jgi:hypothetical protein
LFIAVLILVAPSIAIIRSLMTNEAKNHVSPAQTEQLRVAKSEPHLILQQSASGAVDEVIPLGAQVDDRTADVTLEVRALPPGMAISSGRRLGAVWRIRPADAINATIHPPPGFSGAVDLTVELRRPDDTVVDRGSVHREWLQRPTIAAPPTPMDETARVAVVRHVQPRTGKAHTATKRGAVRSRTHAQAAHDDRYQVYGGGRRVGADPDLDIRMTLAKQYAWLN